jgi:O-antigen ligase
MNTANYGVSPMPACATAQARANGSKRLMELRGLPVDFALLLAYIILCRSYIGDEDSLGIKIGPIPIFITDVALAVIIAISMSRHSGRLLNWAFGGSGAGRIGRAVWLLFLMSLVHFALALPAYGLLAARDLAIFSYSLFFPLTYFALTRRIFAAKLVRYFIYATCIGAVLFNLETIFGLHSFAMYHAAKGLPGHQKVPLLSADNLQDNLSAALAGLFAYLAVQRQRRGLHIGLMLLCLVALAQLGDRSAFLGFFIAGGVMFVLGVGRSRLYLSELAGGLAILLLLSVQGTLPVPGGAVLHRFWLVLSSGANFQTDPDAQFRMERWQSAVQTWMTSPVLGVGFGTPIIRDEWVHSEIKGAAQRDKLGAFNSGMPHNSFLMVLARMGPIGLGLICFAWITAITRMLKVLSRRAPDPDQMAALGVLIAMVPIAALNLFFERPMLCAPFWIVLAASYKLSETVPWRLAGKRTHTAIPGTMTVSAQTVAPPYRPTRQDHLAGGWQARWT